MRDGDFTDVPLADGGELALGAWVAGWTPPPILTLSEWADTHRKLPREASSEPGQWRTDRNPPLRAIMDDLSAHSPVTEVNCKKSTQVGGTEVGINFLGYVIDHAPGPMMYVLPTIPVVREFSDDRLQPMIDLMPRLAKKIGPKRSRDSGNTSLKKKFPAGFVVFSGANSSSSLANKPIKYLVLDELSKYPRDLDKQGSAQVQAERRTSSFTTRKKILRISSPTIKDACAITDEYERGHQATYHVPCPHCLQNQVLHIDQLTDDGQFVCLHCGKLIDESHKTWMLKENGYSDDGLAEWVAKRPERTTVHSYRWWAAYSPIGLGYTWKEIADMRAEARADPEKMVTFVNTILGDAFEGTSIRVEANDILQRARESNWLRRTVPAGALIITAGVDVQVNRFAVQLVAWGRNEQAYIIDYVELPADPTRREDWDILWEFLAQPIKNRAGIDMRISATAVDSGNWTQEVYNAVRPLQSRGVMAIKGSKDPTRPIIGRASKQEVDGKGRVQRRGVQLWMIGVNSAKSTLMQRLLGDQDREEDNRLVHFPTDMPDDYFTMLTSERFDLTARRWLKPKGARNESLDTLVYAYAAALSPQVRIHVKRDADWAALEAKLEPATSDLFASPAQPLPAGRASISPKPNKVADLQTRLVPPGTKVSHANPFASSDWLSRHE